MGEALMLLEKVQVEFGVELLAQHIAGEDNVIAGDLSRDRVERAVVERMIRRITGREPVRVLIPDEWRDTSAIIAAVRAA